MRIHFPACFLLLALAVPAAAQGVPDNIPEPDESIADRNFERLAEAYRPFLSRFFNTSSLDVAPLTTSGLAYQANVNLGYTFDSGDALIVTFAARNLAELRTEETAAPEGLQPNEWYYGATYELRGTRFLGDSNLGRRTALGLGVGVLNGSIRAAALEISPTYTLFSRGAFAFPVGLKLSLAAIGNQERTLTRALLGFNMGVRWYWMAHSRLRLD